MATSKAKAASALAAEDSGTDTASQEQESTPQETAPKTEAAGFAAMADAAPIEAPEAKRARSPHLGRTDSSTNPIAANAALRSPTGSKHLRLLGEADKALTLKDVFAFPVAGSAETLATVKETVYEEFTYPNTTAPARHLLFLAGARVPIGEAYRLIDTYKYADTAEIPEAERPVEEPPSTP